MTCGRYSELPESIESDLWSDKFVVSLQQK